MPLVNLIAIHRSNKRKAEKRVTLMFFSWLILCACFVLVFGFIWLRTELIAREFDRLEEKAKKLAPFRAQTDSMKAEIASVEPKLKTLSSAKTDTDRWLRILNHLTTNTPQGTWFTAVRSELPKDDTKPQTITFIGNAADQTLVSNVMKRLTACSDLEQINLKRSDAQTGIGIASGVEFEIVTILKVPKPKSNDDKGDKKNEGS